MRQRPRGARTRAPRAAPGRTRAPPRLPSSSIQSRFLRPGRDLADHDRAERAGVGLELHDRGVLGRRPARGSPPPPPAANALAPRRAACAPGTAVSSRADSRVMRWPETNSARSHQCEPMSANAREAPPSSLVHAPVVVVGREEPVLEVGAVQQAQRAGPPAARRARAPRAPSGSSGRRTAPPPAARVAPRRRRAAARRRRRAPAASRRSRACRPRARPRPAGRCRWFGVQMWTTSMSGSRDHLLGRVERPLGAELGRGRGARDSGDEAATPRARAGQARRPGVDPPDEPGAGDRRLGAGPSARRR